MLEFLVLENFFWYALDGLYVYAPRVPDLKRVTIGVRLKLVLPHEKLELMKFITKNFRCPQLKVLDFNLRLKAYERFLEWRLGYLRKEIALKVRALHYELSLPFGIK